MNQAQIDRWVRHIKKCGAVSSSVKSYAVGEDRWKYQYDVPCECGHPKCGVDTCFSAYTFTKSEIDQLMSAWEQLYIECPYCGQLFKNLGSIPEHSIEWLDGALVCLGSGCVPTRA